MEMYSVISYETTVLSSKKIKSHYKSSYNKLTVKCVKPNVIQEKSKNPLRTCKSSADVMANFNFKSYFST